MEYLDIVNSIKQLNKADYIIFMGVVSGLILYKKLRSTSVKILVWLLIVTLFVEIATPFRFFRFVKSNHWLYNIFTPIQCSFFAAIYYVSFQKQKRKTFILICGISALFLMLSNALFLQKFSVFNSYSFIVSCIVITLFAFTYLLQQYSVEVDLEFHRKPVFWITIGVLFYFPPNIVITALVTEMFSQYPNLATRLYEITDFLNVIMYSIFFTVIILDSKKSKPHLNTANEQ